MKARNNLKNSSIYPIVIFGLLVMTIMWVTGRVEATLMQYAGAFATIAGVWLGREIKQATQDHYKSKSFEED